MVCIIEVILDKVVNHKSSLQTPASVELVINLKI